MGAAGPSDAMGQGISSDGTVSFLWEYFYLNNSNITCRSLLKLCKSQLQDIDARILRLLYQQLLDMSIYCGNSY